MIRMIGCLIAVLAVPALGLPALAEAPPDIATVYAQICAICHDDGTVGAPIKGDRAAWAPRIAKGREALYDSTLKGLGHMLPRQNRRGYAEIEIKGAVDYLIDQAR